MKIFAGLGGRYICKEKCHLTAETEIDGLKDPCEFTWVLIRLT